jgi:negative regulator of sigma E activity
LVFLGAVHKFKNGGDVAMIPNSEHNNNFPHHPQGDLLNGKIPDQSESVIRAVNTIKRDRFELLSAYLDGEVTAAERRQVEEWLKEPEMQRLYARLMSLRGGLQKMPVPASQMSAEETAKQVFVKLNRRPKRLLLLGGGAIAAMFIAGVSGLMGQQSFSPQLAQTPQTTNVSSDGLMIALNNPVIEIPKAPVANPEKSVISRALIVE